MRPSVARKLNEKIRGLEAELEQLRTNKKVKELEKKVQVGANWRGASWRMPATAQLAGQGWSGGPTLWRQ